MCISGADSSATEMEGYAVPPLGVGLLLVGRWYVLKAGWAYRLLSLTG